MSTLFSKPKMPAMQKAERMPTMQDPDVLAAAQRTRASALNRKGRLSTIMTDMTKATTGSSGTKLGA